MNNSQGMGIELPVWIITTKSNKKFFNKRENEFVSELVEQCAFDTPNDANNALKQLDYGYVVKAARLYRDINNTSIRIV